MHRYVIFHNPRCSKSRAALKILTDHGLQPVVRTYLDDPPDARELKQLRKLLNSPARDLLRTGETEYTALGLDDTGLDEAHLIRAMVEHPRLIQRPIIIRDQQTARIARPPETVLQILP